ncbi:MAG: hypothetical protein WBG50_13670 [Desulfomonilaceae bacterium]
MASIVDLCWTSSEDLFENLDLDALYARQVRTVGGASCPKYPYLILVYTGKITIGINLGRGFEQQEAALRQSRNGDLPLQDDPLYS